MSYAILGGLPDSHLLTFRTTREVKCLYFDGTSASLMDDGSMDSQMLLLFNSSDKVPPPPRFGPPVRNGSSAHRGNGTFRGPIEAEYDRAHGLCDLIKRKDLGGIGWGYEGIVRMNTGFELIWCNFSSPSAKLISWLNVSAPVLEGEYVEGPNLPARPPSDGGIPSGPYWREIDPHPFSMHAMYSWFRAATKRYGFVGSVPGRGEARVKVDSCNLLTFYDPKLKDQESYRICTESDKLNLTSEGHWPAPKDDDERRPALTSLMRRRRGQRADHVSVSDGLYMQKQITARMRAALDGKAESCSGIDWIQVAKEIVTAYSAELYALNATLGESLGGLNSTEFRSWLSRFRPQVHDFWMPYYEYPYLSNDTLAAAFSLSAPESQAALQRCEKQYEPDDDQTLSASEQVTYAANAEVLMAICGTLLPIFLGVEHVWLAHFNNASAPALPSNSSIHRHIARTVSQNQHTVEELMAWLGWVEQWTACSPGCSLGQTCYIPMWPAIAVGGLRGRDALSATEGVYHDRPDGRRNFDNFLWEPQCIDSQ